jgi:transcriptional regulator with XRE-family HTH domain
MSNGHWLTAFRQAGCCSEHRGGRAGFDRDSARLGAVHEAEGDDMTTVMAVQAKQARQPNTSLRRARLLAPMSRQQLADALNANIFQRCGIQTSIDAHYIARLEQGKRRWPNSVYREAFRAVLGASTDVELGFGPPQRSRPQLLCQRCSSEIGHVA